ncbi:class I SAM-dependent methyltransferase [Natronoglomus mannanivorans]|uniref:Methyltransferase domain-containing protein n=1 Tax=Natronoglomus mannanivorans TaxID=2979990 RepID=A0AAP2Z240_9EURY|nr:methyltransferase domain-containing protein [Halobacteria archaeon AArc-xg1-1]
MTRERDAQQWNPATYDDAQSFVAAYGSSVVDLLEPAADERILDLGCGTGHLTWEIADAGATAVGLDSSAAMIERARETYSHTDADSNSNSTDVDLEFVYGDARSLAFDYAFDAVFSNAALHWIPDDDQDEVLASVHDALCPGGRFVAELGGRGNVAPIVDAVQDEGAARGYDIESPWYFPSVGEYARRLEDADLEVQYARLFDRPTELEGEDGLRDWLEQFGDRLFASASVPADERVEIVEAVEERLREREGDGEEYYRDGTWIAPYRRLRFVAVAK